MRTVPRLLLSLSIPLQLFACSNGAGPTGSATAVQAAQTAPPAATTAAAAPAASPPSRPTAPGASPGGIVACSAAALPGPADVCISPSCADIPASMTACTADADCQLGTFSTCECAFPGPYFSVNAKSKQGAFDLLKGKYAGECTCGCQMPTPVCVSGTCGFKAAKAP